MNIISFQLVTGGQCWNVVGCYLAPCNTSTLESVIAVIGHRTRGMDLLVDVNFIEELESMDGNECEKEIVADMVTDGLKYMMEHLLPSKLPWTRDVWTWIMLRLSQEVSSRTVYILGMGRCLIQNVDSRDPRHNTDY